MFVVSAEEFEKQITSGLKKKKYQNKLLSSGPLFSKANKQLAISYCHNYVRKKQVCFVVEEKYYFQIWYEQNSSMTNQTIQTNKGKRSPQSRQDTLALQEKVMVDRVFVDRCQKILLQLIGPFATILCQQTFAQNPNLEQSQFIELIARQIPASQKAEEFKQQLQSK